MGFRLPASEIEIAETASLRHGNNHLIFFETDICLLAQSQRAGNVLHRSNTNHPG
jgi:hypothetical protein